ncbi:MAG TPA: energy-coupling factor transporter transmembrane protein EcfT [Candidatus Monoglobus merdigallinarum]|uniref:Energy-coupling factor transporter transmembrane protein EcfT n=1 Tax=Candidatus Monoglobus merdigallinarum TaxID=2838698 RepID=A0A9D1PQZ3_9FIRM|nr:energy-coupling factor transporter transmembrane protein EcfT [Candidatus Monoglobus merdigallinarum]
MRDEFSRFHPTVNFLYFTAVIVFSTIYMNPILLGISLICALLYSIYLEGARSLKLSLLVVLPIGLFAAAVNIAFNHNGMTVLGYFPTGNPLTLESIAYGVSAAVLLADVILWFFCFNRVITSDKFIYLFGKIIPALSLVLSMALRFVPRFKQQLHSISTAQRSISTASEKGLFSKIKHGVNVFSIMLTWSLENSVTTADSMNSRGYGLKGRTAFTRYRFYFRDGVMILVLTALLAVQITLTLLGHFHTEFYPYFELSLSGLQLFGCFTYAALCLIPLIINLTEDIKWNYFRSKI